MEQLAKQRNDQCTIGLNFETRRPRRDILADYKKVIERIYDADAYFARVLRVARKLNRFWPPEPPSAFTIYGIPLRDVMKLFRLVALMTLQQPRLLGRFARTFWTCARENSGSIHMVAVMSALYLHFGPFSRIVAADIGRQIAAIDRGEWQRPDIPLATSLTDAVLPTDPTPAAQHAHA